MIDTWEQICRSGERNGGLPRATIYRGASPEVPEDHRILLKKIGRRTYVSLTSIARFIKAQPDAEVRSGPRRIGVKRDTKTI